MTDQPTYEAVLAVLDDHPDWERDDEIIPYDEAVDKAETRGGAELFYRHADTDAQLHLSGMGYGVVRGALRQPLDINLIEGEESEFRGALADAYGRIADDHQTAYTGDAYDVLQQSGFTVPEAYDQADIERTIDAVSTISQVVQDIHDDLYETLEQ